MKIRHRTLLDVLGGIAVVAIFIIWSIGEAQASGNQNHECQGGHNCNNTEGGGDATATADANAYAGAYAEGGAGGAGGNASINVQVGGTDANGNAAPLATGGSLTVNEAARPDDITIRNTAAARMPGLTATAPCVLSGSIGLGIAGANIGGGKTKIDPECNIRETARTFAGLGEIELALKIACSSETAVAVLGEACGLTTSNVYVRVNEPIRYVERASDAVHDVSKEALDCLLYTSPSPRDVEESRMPSSA